MSRDVTTFGRKRSDQTTKRGGAAFTAGFLRRAGLDHAGRAIAYNETPGHAVAVVSKHHRATVLMRFAICYDYV